MSRQIVLDTETTGLDPVEHRIIEIGCIEIIDRRRSRREPLHFYLNPERSIDAGALAVHGLTEGFLADKPRFGEIHEEFLAYIADAELIIHNAAFDVGFLDAELRRLDPTWPGIAAAHGILDTLSLARQRHPGQRNSLDALCKRYSVDNSRRELHGALLDAALLCDVYLAMTGGQAELLSPLVVDGALTEMAINPTPVATPLVAVQVTPDELDAHSRRMEAIAKKAGSTTW